MPKWKNHTGTTKLSPTRMAVLRWVSFVFFCRWISTQNLLWCISRTAYAGTSSLSEFKSEIALFVSLTFCTHSRWWSSMSSYNMTYLLNNFWSFKYWSIHLLLIWIAKSYLWDQVVTHTHTQKHAHTDDYYNPLPIMHLLMHVNYWYIIQRTVSNDKSLTELTDC